MNYMTPRRSSQNLRSPSSMRMTPSMGNFSPSIIDSPTATAMRRNRAPSEQILRRHTSMLTLPSSASRAASALGHHSTPAAPPFQGTIHVGVRSKPEPEADRQWLVDRDTNCVSHAAAGDFGYDQVYDGFSTNAHVFEKSAKHIVGKVAEGYNGVVFAYGTTGSGKTFSMRGNDDDPGVVQRSVKYLFRCLKKRHSECTVQLSYIEIYNERVCDLLAEDTGKFSGDLMLRDDELLGVRAVGATELVAGSAEELLNWIKKGDLFRKTSATQHNEHSSRSHAIVMIQVHSTRSHSSLYLCDLAGSERAVLQADRRKEGSYINKSLLSLGSVISRLSAGGAGHVPFRDSKLTRLLQPSLSGQALIAVICTIQTNTSVMSETLNTLRFASRAKNVVVNAKYGSLNEDGVAQGNAMIERLLRSVDQLKNENCLLKGQIREMSLQKDDLQGKLDLVIESDLDAMNDSLEHFLGISESNKPANEQRNSSSSEKSGKHLTDNEGKMTSDLMPPSPDSTESQQLLSAYEEQSFEDRKEIELLRCQVSELLTKVAEAHVDLEDVQRASLISSSTTASSNTSDLISRVAYLETELNHSKKELAYLRSLPSQYGNEEMLNKLLADRSELQRQVDRLSGDAGDMARTSLVSKLETECATLRRALSSAENTIAELSQSTELTRGQQEEQQRELDGLRSSLFNSAAEVEALKAKLLRRENEVVRLRSSLGQHQDIKVQFLALKQSNAELQAQVDRHNSENDMKLSERVESLHRSVEQATEEHANAKSTLQTKDTEISSLSHQLAEAKDQLAQQSSATEIANLQEAVHKLERQVEGLEAENSRLRRSTLASSFNRHDSDSSRDTMVSEFDQDCAGLRDSRIRLLEKEIAMLRVGKMGSPTPPSSGDEEIGKTQYLMEEIGDLRNTLADKDRIIAYLKKSMGRRATIQKLGPAGSRPQSPTSDPISPISELRSPRLRQKSSMFSVV